MGVGELDAMQYEASMCSPRRVNDTLHPVDLNGYVFPWEDGRPVFVLMQGSLDTFLPLFADEQALHRMMRHAAIRYSSIKVVDDQGEFIDSLPLYLAGGRLRIMIDPYKAANGCIRFKELIRETMLH
jgi:hypothetical protein